MGLLSRNNIAFRLFDRLAVSMIDTVHNAFDNLKVSEARKLQIDNADPLNRENDPLYVQLLKPNFVSWSLIVSDSRCIRNT